MSIKNRVENEELKQTTVTKLRKENFGGSFVGYYGTINQLFRKSIETLEELLVEKNRSEESKRKIIKGVLNNIIIEEDFYKNVSNCRNNVIFYDEQQESYEQKIEEIQDLVEKEIKDDIYYMSRLYSGARVRLNVCKTDLYSARSNNPQEYFYKYFLIKKLIIEELFDKDLVKGYIRKKIEKKLLKLKDEDTIETIDFKNKENKLYMVKMDVSLSDVLKNGLPQIEIFQYETTKSSMYDGSLHSQYYIYKSEKRRIEIYHSFPMFKGGTDYVSIRKEKTYYDDERSDFVIFSNKEEASNYYKKEFVDIRNTIDKILMSEIIM